MSAIAQTSTAEEDESPYSYLEALTWGGRYGASAYCGLVLRWDLESGTLYATATQSQLTHRRCNSIGQTTQYHCLEDRKSCVREGWDRGSQYAPTCTIYRMSKRSFRQYCDNNDGYYLYLLH